MANICAVFHLLGAWLKVYRCLSYASDLNSVDDWEFYNEHHGGFMILIQNMDTTKSAGDLPALLAATSRNHLRRDWLCMRN